MEIAQLRELAAEHLIRVSAPQTTSGLSEKAKKIQAVLAKNKDGYGCKSKHAAPLLSALLGENVSVAEKPIARPGCLVLSGDGESLLLSQVDPSDGMVMGYLRSGMRSSWKDTNRLQFAPPEQIRRWAEVVPERVLRFYFEHLFAEEADKA